MANRNYSKLCTRPEGATTRKWQKLERRFQTPRPRDEYRPANKTSRMSAVRSRNDDISKLSEDVSNLQLEVRLIQDSLHAISEMRAHSGTSRYGTCGNHPRLGCVEWERSDVPCPVCARNTALELIVKETLQGLGMTKPEPVWSLYFSLWDLTEEERRKRVGELIKMLKKCD